MTNMTKIAQDNLQRGLDAARYALTGETSGSFSSTSLSPRFKPETRTTSGPDKNAIKPPEETYSSNINPNRKFGMPVYNATASEGYTIDYNPPEDEATGGSESNEKTQGNNAETVGNVNDEDNKNVGNFLNKNIFGGLSEAANPGESLS